MNILTDSLGLQQSLLITESAHCGEFTEKTVCLYP